MKKILYLLFLLLFFLSAYGAETLKFGVISDIQMYDVPGGTNRVWMALDKAFFKMKAEKVDAIVVAGDVGPWNDVATYRRFRRRYEEVFGENPPAFLVVMGNHDTALHLNGKWKWCKDAKQLAETRSVFCRELKLEDVNFHKIIKGYDFIGLSMSVSGAACTKEDIVFLKKELDAAMARDPEKPIFVVAHNHAKDTVFGSGHGDKKIADLLKNYPHAVYFSGHTHYPLEDERMIHQKDFTSVGTGALISLDLPGSRLPYTGNPNAGKNMMIVSCFPEKIVLHRYQLRDDSEVLDHGQPWTLPLPLEKKNFVYEPERRIAAMKRVAPEFSAEAKISAKWQSGEKPMVVLKGTAATHPDFVLLYRIFVSRKTGKGFEKCAELISYSDFSDGLNFRSKQFTVKIPSKTPKKKGQSFLFVPVEHYRFEVFPEENFGLRGKPLCAELTIPQLPATTAKENK